MDVGDVQKLRDNYDEGCLVAEQNGLPLPQYPPKLESYENMMRDLTWIERQYLEEFNDISTSRVISLGGMGGALVGHLSYQEIKAFLDLGLSSIDDPVDVYAKIIRWIDREYVSEKQKKIDDDSKKASEKSGSSGKKPMTRPPRH